MKEIICANNLDVLREIPDAAIDIVITSPPYNLRAGSGATMSSKPKTHKTLSGKNTTTWHAKLREGYKDFDDNLPHVVYVEQQREIIRECMRIIPNSGAFFYNTKFLARKGIMDFRSEIIEGFPCRQMIIWQRSGGLNHEKSYLLQTYEVIFVFAKSLRFKFKQEATKLTDVWKITQELNNPHPAPFPLEIPMRIINSCDCEIVLDPYNGSGTTTLAAHILDKNYIGIDISKQYCDDAIKRIEQWHVANR